MIQKFCWAFQAFLGGDTVHVEDLGLMIAGFSLDSRPMIGERGRAVVLASTIGNEGLSTVMNSTVAA